MREPWLDELETLLIGSDGTTAAITVASVAGRDVDVHGAEARAAGRRALLVLAAGGDPHRGLDLRGPAVTRFAVELETPDRRDQLEDGLFALLENAIGLPHVTEAARELLTDKDVAWRAFACSVLAEQLAEDLGGDG